MDRPQKVNVSANRAARKWTTKQQLGRFLWIFGEFLFHISPRPLWAWRRNILRLFGAQIGEEVHIYPSVKITIPWNIAIDDYAAIGDRAILYALGPIQIGRDATISQGAHICAGTHDYNHPEMPLLKSPITIDDAAWICADAFIGPGVTIGTGAIVGARAVACKNVASNTVVIGNPAKKLRDREPYESINTYERARQK